MMSVLCITALIHLLCIDPYQDDPWFFKVLQEIEMAEVPTRYMLRFSFTVAIREVRQKHFSTIITWAECHLVALLKMVHILLEKRQDLPSYCCDLFAKCSANEIYSELHTCTHTNCGMNML